QPRSRPHRGRRWRSAASCVLARYNRHNARSIRAARPDRWPNAGCRDREGLPSRAASWVLRLADGVATTTWRWRRGLTVVVREKAALVRQVGTHAPGRDAVAGP